MTSSSTEVNDLLNTSNDASEKVSILHVAFMGICTYVLVIVFGTTDLDLLMGKGVKLPIIDVEVPIVGFYAAAPFLVVLVHLNLLLQLQLLSRKLYAFDKLAPAKNALGGPRDRLHIFPYTYYLVGRSGAIVAGLIGLVVTITFVILPLITLFGLQLRFLAYQDAVITWAQRGAIWLDVIALMVMWPVILHRKDSWRCWWRDTLSAHGDKNWVLAVLVLLVTGISVILLSATPFFFWVGFSIAITATLISAILHSIRDSSTLPLIRVTLLLLGTAMTLWLIGWPTSSIGKFIEIAIVLVALILICFWYPSAPRGSLALLFAMVLAPITAIAVMTDGEGWEKIVVGPQVHEQQLTKVQPFDGTTLYGRAYPEAVMESSEKKSESIKDALALAEILKQHECIDLNHTIMSCLLLPNLRRLDLEEQRLFAKRPSAETLAIIQAGNWNDILDKIEPVKLRERNLRRARLNGAVLTGADLRSAQLQGADLSLAQLQGANLSGAYLDRADIRSAKMQGAELSNASLVKVWATRAQMQEAILNKAWIRSADFRWVGLQGAKLIDTDLHLSDFAGANMQGATLIGSHFGCVKLSSADFQSADLSFTQFVASSLFEARLEGTSMRGVTLMATTLTSARLDGADLRDAIFNGIGHPYTAVWVDVRGLQLGTDPAAFVTAEAQRIQKRVSDREIGEEKDIYTEAFYSCSAYKIKDDVVESFKVAESLKVDSCFVDERSRKTAHHFCKIIYMAESKDMKQQFLSSLRNILYSLACSNRYIAEGLLKQIPDKTDLGVRFGPEKTLQEMVDEVRNVHNDSTRIGLAVRFTDRRDEGNPSCQGLFDLWREHEIEWIALRKR